MVIRVLLLAVVVFASTASTALAQTSAEKKRAKQYFEKGNAAFNDGRYTDALGSYEKSYALVPRPRTLNNIAACHERLGHDEDAYLAYRAFIPIAEERDAELRAKAEGKLLELAPRIRIPVRVTSSPVGAAITIDGDGEVAGRTPAELSLSLGSHQLTLRAEGFHDHQATIEVAAGDRPVVDAALDPLPRITITVEPADALITPADGVAAAGTWSTVVVPGSYKFTITRSGYIDQAIEVIAEGSEPVARHVVLEERPRPPVREIVTVPPEVEAPPTPGRRLRYVGIAAAALGGISVAIGAKLGLDARSASNASHDEAERTGRWDGDAIALLHDAEVAQDRMFVAYAVGAAAVIGGGVLYFLGARADAHARAVPTVSAAVSPGSFEVLWSGAF